MGKAFALTRLIARVNIWSVNQ